MGKLVRFRRKDRVKRATDARPSLFSSDACSALETPIPGRTPDPEIERRNARRLRTGILALVIVFLGGTAAALFGDRGYLDVQRQRARHSQLHDAHAARLEHVKALRHEVERLKTEPTAIERIAREDLGFAAHGEITLLLPGNDPAAHHGLDAKTGSAIVRDVSKTP